DHERAPCLALAVEAVAAVDDERLGREPVPHGAARASSCEVACHDATISMRPRRSATVCAGHVRNPVPDVSGVRQSLGGGRVSGGGDFGDAVKRGVESPWDRIRALKSGVKTPLGLALRGRFVVGSRPVDADFAQRFVACAAENGIDVFRLHDPLNDVSNLREAAEAIEAAGREFDAGLVYSPGKTGETDSLVEQARKLPELGAARVVLHDPTGSLQPHRAPE